MTLGISCINLCRLILINYCPELPLGNTSAGLVVLKNCSHQSWKLELLGCHEQRKNCWALWSITLSPGLMANDIKVSPHSTPCIAAVTYCWYLGYFGKRSCLGRQSLNPTNKRDVCLECLICWRTKMMIVSPVSLVCGQLAGEGWRERKTFEIVFKSEVWSVNVGFTHWNCPPMIDK